MTTQPNNNRRQLKGTVVSDGMDKTRVVLVERFKKHPRYEKIYRRSRKFKAHDEQNQYKKGDFVVMRETRPLSKDKCWEIIEKISTDKAVKIEENLETQLIEEQIEEEKKEQSE